MDAYSWWMVLVAINTCGYVVFVVRRDEAGWRSSLVLAAVLGPLVWVVWVSQRAGRARAESARSDR